MKLTNSDTSTATATVRPNWKKNLPTMPLMKAIGTNTATMAKVVAITASPISSVPSRAAVAWSLPMARWRTMFSRTTMASSISRPMHSDSAISVRKLSVNPNALRAMKVAMTASGSVRPVITVLRQLWRNRKTISTVSVAPSRIVSLTRLTEASTLSAVELTTRSSTAAGRRSRRTLTASATPLPVSTMLASCAFWMSSVIAGRPLIRANDVSSFSPSTMSATCDRKTAAPPAGRR